VIGVGLWPWPEIKIRASRSIQISNEKSNEWAMHYIGFNTIYAIHLPFNTARDVLTPPTVGSRTLGACI